MTRVTLMSQGVEAQLRISMDNVAETTQDFTDSAYTSHEDRELILMNCERLRHEMAVLVRIGFQLVSHSVGPCVGRSLVVIG